METTQLRPSRTPIVSGTPDTSTPTNTGENTHNSADFAAFLTHFEGPLTYQTFDDDKTDEHVKNPALSKILHNPTTEQLIALSRRGAGIYLMVNCGDGAGREKGNVTKIRAFFADFDGAALPEKWPLEPSLITETSAGKFHVYWFLSTDNDVLLTNDAWNAQQKQIARMVGSQEKDCTGLNRVMRVPGFPHLKDPKNLFMTRILTATGNRYDLADITAAFPVPAPRPAAASSTATDTITATLTGRQAIQQKYAQKVLQEECANLAATPEGNRNNVLNGTAYRVGRLVGGGHLDADEAQRALLDAARTAGLPDHRITATLNSGFYDGIGEPDHLDHVGTQIRTSPGSGAPVATPVTEQCLVIEDASTQITYTMPAMPEGVQPGTDAANAIILSANNLQDRMRYTPTLEWLLYDEKRGIWQPNTDQSRCATVAGQILRGAVGQHLAATIARDAGKEETEKAVRWAKSVCQFQTVANALKVAAGFDEFRTDADQWDAHPDLLNCKNGVLELKTGVLRPHSPADLMTLQSGAEYRPEVTHPAVDQLVGWLNQDGKAEFLQRNAGSALYGANPNEILTVLQGLGGSGKGTFCDGIKAVLGSYGHTIDVNLLLLSGWGEGGTGAKPELLALRSKRLVIAGEPPKGGRFNAGRVKGMTGNDAITARGMRSDVMVTFKPVFKLWMHSNYPVTTDHDDTGMQRRLKIAPFNSKPAHADPHFKETLQRDPDALSALLNWMYVGFRAWFDDGYNLASTTVDQATGHYWQSQDVYGRFAEDVLQFDATEQIPSAHLKQLFETWVEEEGIKAGREATIRDLQAYLTNRGCHPDKGAKGIRIWRGVGVARG